VGALVAFGLALRLATFLKNPPLGLDEARLALNIGSRSYVGLLRPLDFDQSAPPLYLWLQRGVVDLMGVHDWALRLVPLAAGIGLMLLVPRVFARLLGPRALVAATAVAAFSPLLIQYSVSAKQYGVEACLTLVVLGLALRCRDASWRAAPAARMTAVGALLPWCMTPAGFVLFGVAGCALADLREDRAQARRFLIRTTPLWAVSLAIAYLVAYEPASRNPYMRRYWSSALLSPEGGSFADRVWAILNENLWGLALGYPGPPGRHLPNAAFLAAALVLLTLLAAGCRSLLSRHGRGVLLLAVVPLLAAVCASVAGIYPFGLRLTLFGMPLVQLLLLAGLDRALMRLPDGHARRAWVAACFALVLPLAAIALLQAQRGEASEDVRALVKDLSGRRRQEAVYVFAASIPPWAYYTTDWSAPDRRRLGFLAQIAGAGGAAFENAPSRARVDDRETAGLDYRTSSGAEIYGLATGIEWTPNLGPRKSEPDAGWAVGESRRVASLDAPAWVLMSHMVGGERELLRKIERRGACATYVRELDNAILVRYVPASAEPGRKCAATPHPVGVR
jgi:4-amino-4-deoxy-L-arabinose transferase-like glycosyltransferase